MNFGLWIALGVAVGWAVTRGRGGRREQAGPQRCSISVDASIASAAIYRTRAAGLGVLALFAALGFGQGLLDGLTPAAARDSGAASMQRLAWSGRDVPDAVPTTYVQTAELRQAPPAPPRPAARRRKPAEPEAAPLLDLAAAPAASPAPGVVSAGSGATDASAAAPLDPAAVPWMAPPPEPAAEPAPPPPAAPPETTLQAPAG